MSSYIEGFVLSIPKRKMADYKKLATAASKIYREYGALDYRECVADDVAIKGFVSFPKMAKSKPGEVVIFSYVVFKSRKHRDTANRKIMADPRMKALCPSAEAILDCKRMAYGGFKTLVQF